MSVELAGRAGAPNRPMGEPQQPLLIGRQGELAILDELTDRIDVGSGGSIVIHGEAGSGKTVLLDHVRSRAQNRGFQTLKANGSPSESQLPFAGLHQMLRPILDLTVALPDGLRAALGAAFGDREGPSPEPFLIALGTLELVSEAAARSPVVILVDDAQWLDESSRTTIAFVARRLETEPIVMVVTQRSGHKQSFDTAWLRELELGALDAEASSTLLRATSPGLPTPTEQKILSLAAGNPLALLELPSIAPIEDADRTSAELGLFLTDRLEQAFSSREAELPPRTRTILLVAATDEANTSEILRAAGSIEGRVVTLDDLEPAIVARLVSLEGDRLRFRHPLIRSAIYQVASPGKRSAAHRALADVLIDEPDRWIWHTTAAHEGPSEKIAADLDQAAQRARRQGAMAVAATAYERAAEVGDDIENRNERLLQAAELSLELGQTQRGLDLLQRANPEQLSDEQAMRVVWLYENYDETRWSGTSELSHALEVAEKVGADEPSIALELLVAIARRCWWTAPSEEYRRSVVRVLEGLCLDVDDPSRLCVLAHVDPIEFGASVTQQISRLRPLPGDSMRTFLLGIACSAVWEYDLALKFLNSAIDGFRVQGRVGLLVPALVEFAWCAAHLAREPLAIAAADEALRLAAETGHRRLGAMAKLAQATIHAERGETDRAEGLVIEAERLLQQFGATPFLSLAQFVRGRGSVAHQRYDEGLHHLQRALDPSDPAYQPYVGAWGLSDLIEAAARSGDLQTANRYLGDLEDLARLRPTSLLRATAGYARPMVASDQAVEALYRTAIEQDLVNWPCYRGRLLLWYGRWLRRERRIAEARNQLRAALNGFEALAFPTLVEMAQQELRAAGERSRKNTPGWDQLTPQELQVANMASKGLSNREIGERLYISHRTVGYHLYRIYPKLGVTSRSQLREALSSQGHAVEDTDSTVLQ